MADSKPIVVVTGGSGFLATHVCKRLVDTGLYTVRATVRSKSPDKTDFLESIGIEVFENCDLLVPESFDAAFKGCTYVQHCASPFILNFTDAQSQLVTPAVEGTNNVMAAALKTATVKQVVVTSSGAAVVWQKAITHPQGADYVWNEDDWQEDNTLEIVPYRLSKRLAEHAAFDFVKENSPDGKPCFGLATICPTYIMGPVLTPRLDSESVLFMRRLLDGTVTELSGYAVGFVDVRNVAEAQVNAMTLDLDTPGVKNKHGEARFILSSEETWPQIEIANALRKCPDFKGWPIPEKAPPQTQDIKYSNKRAREFLGIKFTSLEETVAAGCKSLVEKGLVKKSEPV